MMRYREADVALEWWRASGEKTLTRLAELVDHELEVNAIREPCHRDAIHQAARDGIHSWEEYSKR